MGGTQVRAVSVDVDKYIHGMVFGLGTYVGVLSILHEPFKIPCVQTHPIQVVFNRSVILVVDCSFVGKTDNVAVRVAAKVSRCQISRLPWQDPPLSLARSLMPNSHVPGRFSEALRVKRLKTLRPLVFRCLPVKGTRHCKAHHACLEVSCNVHSIGNIASPHLGAI